MASSGIRSEIMMSGNPSSAPNSAGAGQDAFDSGPAIPVEDGLGSLWVAGICFSVAGFCSLLLLLIH